MLSFSVPIVFFEPVAAVNHVDTDSALNLWLIVAGFKDGEWCNNTNKLLTAMRSLWNSIYTYFPRFVLDWRKTASLPVSMRK